ncbi:hypothetical protein EV363DRAFT_1554772 [Boletus edulis]|nr:hypothetical protein EV363DRAFT_1554772 [Boletus edulis]
MLHSILAMTLTVQCAETPSKIDLFEDLILNKARLCDLLDVGQPSSQEKRKPQSEKSSSALLFKMNTAENINSSADNRASDGRKQSPPAFLDLADSAARLGTNMPDISAELLTIPYDSVGLAISAPTTPPRVNTALHGDNNFIKSALSHSSVDAEVLFKAIGSVVSDKRKSVAYAPSVDLSPELGSAVNGQYNRVGAKSMPASRRTFTSSHDEELVEHFRGMALSGERPNRATPSPGPVTQSMMVSGRCNKDDHARPGKQYNVGMMLDEQLDQEMHNVLRNLPTSDDDKFASYANKISTSSAALDLAHRPQTSPWNSFAARCQRPYFSLSNSGGDPEGLRLMERSPEVVDQLRG